MKNTVLGALVLTAAPLMLAACGETAEAPAAEEANTIAGVEVSDARLVLPPVSGNPGAVYLTLTNNGDRSLTVRNAEVSGAARSEIHETIMQGEEMVMGEGHPFTVQPGGSEEFAPGGRHIMAFELGEDLAAGSTAEVTLIVAGGKRHSFEATVQAAGDDR